MEDFILKLEEAKKHLEVINNKINLFKVRDYFIEEVEYNYGDKDEQFESTLIMDMINHLSKVSGLYELLNKEIALKGNLSLNDDKRYAIIDNGFYYTSGSPIIFYHQEFEEWCYSRVEHKNDYYIVDYPNVKMEGLLVQVRR